MHRDVAELAGPYLLTGVCTVSASQGFVPSNSLEECVNDCACSVFPATGLPPSAGLFQACDEVYLDEIRPGTFVALPVSSPVGPVVLDRTARALWQSFTAPRALENDLEKWMAACGLLQPLECAPHAPASASSELTAWLHVTNACNLDCPYCYVRKSSQTMRLETGIRVVRDLFAAARQEGYTSLKLKLAGGEAMLHVNLVRALYAEAQRCSEAADLPFSAVVLSNGVNLRETDARWLAETGARLMISIDGVGAAHDRLRSTRGGQATFAAIERNVDDLLLPNGVRPFISITISGLNAAFAADAARWALQRDLPVSLNFYRAPLSGAGQPELALHDPAVIEGMQAVYRVFEELLPERPFLNGLLDRFAVGAHSQTCGAGGAYRVFGQDGQPAACHMLLDPLTGSGARLDNLPVEDKPACRGCTYRHYCTGGCPLEAFRATGRWDARSPNCDIYRALIPSALRLEGLRLLKVNQLL